MEVIDYDELQRLKLKMSKEEYELEKRKATAVSIRYYLLFKHCLQNFCAREWKSLKIAPK